MIGAAVTGFKVSGGNFFGRTNNNDFGFASAGTLVLTAIRNEKLLNVQFDWSLGWTSDGFHTSQDLSLFRDAADTLAQRRGTNAQTFRVYGSFTSASVYNRLALSSTTSIATVAAETDTGDMDLALTPAGSGNVRYGTHSAIGAETITGYIEIKDAGGTVRKLAVVS
jgi:hypothetical protein